MHYTTLPDLHAITIWNDSLHARSITCLLHNFTCIYSWLNRFVQFYMHLQAITSYTIHPTLPHSYGTYLFLWYIPWYIPDFMVYTVIYTIHSALTWFACYHFQVVILHKLASLYFLPSLRTVGNSCVNHRPAAPAFGGRPSRSSQSLLDSMQL